MIHKISLFPLILIHYSGYCKFLFLLWEFVLEMVLHVWYVPLPVCGADIDKTWTLRASLMFCLSAFSHWPTTACTVSFSPPRLWKTWSDVATCVWFCMNYEKIYIRLNLSYTVTSYPDLYFLSMISQCNLSILSLISTQDFAPNKHQVVKCLFYFY